MNAPSDEALVKYVLSVAKGGNIRTTTLKAFSEGAYRTIVGEIA